VVQHDLECSPPGRRPLAAQRLAHALERVQEELGDVHRRLEHNGRPQPRHVIVESPQRHALRVGHPRLFRCARPDPRHAQQSLGLERGERSSAERSGQLRGPVLGPRQPHHSARRARGEIEPLRHVALEALEAELAVQPAVDDLAQHRSHLEVDRLQERNGRAEPLIQLVRRARAEAFREAIEFARCPVRERHPRR
jgi:hypothetical protein